MATFKEDRVPYTKLLLDPNNYRFHDSTDFVRAEESRFHEQGVQDRTSRRLRDDGLVQLKNSIIKNGFLPVERLVVRPYPHHAADHYLVLEGNRRLAALRWIAEDQAAGVSVSPSVLASLQQVPVVIVEDFADDPAFPEALMGIRHVSGIKEWGGYQRAKLVATLRDAHSLDSTEVAERLGLSTAEVNRRYKAFKALQQMQDNEDFGALAHADMYPLFHEAVALPVVREWLGWDDIAGRFTNEENLEHFYDLVTPNNPEEAISKDPKITTYAQVRELRSIIPNPEAKIVLLDPSRGFLDALTIAKREEISRSWVSQVAAAINSLQSMGVMELKNLSPEDIKEIQRLRDTATELIANHQKLLS